MVIRKENIIMKKYYILISLFTFLLMGCEEDNLHKPYGPDDGIAPGKVEVLSYTPTAGGAIITSEVQTMKTSCTSLPNTNWHPVKKWRAVFLHIPAV